jgi:hypothetical protein
MVAGVDVAVGEWTEKLQHSLIQPQFLAKFPFPGLFKAFPRLQPAAREGDLAWMVTHSGGAQQQGDPPGAMPWIQYDGDSGFVAGGTRRSTVPAVGERRMERAG